MVAKGAARFFFVVVLFVYTLLISFCCASCIHCFAEPTLHVFLHPAYTFMCASKNFQSSGGGASGGGGAMGGGGIQPSGMPDGGPKVW